METSSEEIKDQIASFKIMSREAKQLIDELIRKTDKKNAQKQALLVLLTKVIKEFDAYTLLVENGFGEQAAQLIRSIYHLCLWMRYSLLSYENAQLYFESGKIELTKMIEKNLSKGLMVIKGHPDSEKIKQIIKEKSNEITLPNVDIMAKETGYSDFHLMTYKFLSAMAHGSLFLIDDNNKITYLPNDNDIEPFLPLVNNLFRDCYLLTDIWFTKGEIRPVPNIL